MSELQVGDYVLATKYYDGDPGDHFAVGFYAGTLAEFGKPDRHMVLDAGGLPFRANGFRRVKKISTARGKWLVARLKEIEAGSRSVWWWARQKLREQSPSDMRARIAALEEENRLLHQRLDELQDG